MDILAKCFCKGIDFVARDIAGEVIIVPVRDGVGDLNSIYTLNELGARVWQLIDGRTRVKDIVSAITAEYEVTEEEARKDVSEFLASLETARLITEERFTP